MGASRRYRNGSTLAALAAGVALSSLLQSFVLPALSTVQSHIHTSQHTVTWVLTAYLLAASVFTPILGRVGDMIGKRKVFIFCCGCLVVGSLLSAMATSVAPMLAGRAICGFAGGMLPLAFGIIRDVFPEDQVAVAIGALSALGGIGAAVGIVVAGPVLDGLGYVWLFWLPMIAAAVATVAAFAFVPESPVRQPGRISWPAPALLSAWLVALLLGISKAPDWGWGSARVLGLIAAAAVLAVAWVRVEHASAVPLIDMRMMRRTAVWTSNLVALLLGFGLYALYVFAPEFLQTSPATGYGFGSTVTESGLILLPQAVTVFLASALSGRLLRRFVAKNLLVAGFALTVVPAMMLALFHGEVWIIALELALIGATWGLVFPVIPSIIFEAVPAEQTGAATGMNANIRTIGGALGAAVVSTIITSSAGADAIPTEAGYSWGFAAIAISAAVGLLACLLIPSARRARVGAATEGAALEYPELATPPAAPASSAGRVDAGRH